MLGLVTIGQSPREDVVHSMFGDSAPAFAIEAGALDELDVHEIAELYPESGDQPLVTRLRDGSEVVIGKQKMLPHLHRAIAQLENAGCSMVCVLCTGEFPSLSETAMMVYPDRVIVHLIEALLPEGTLGVLMPHQGQHTGMVKKWSTEKRTTVTAVASPYTAADSVAQEVRRLVENGADAVVLDCMGFSRQMLWDARSATNKSVMLANGIVGSVLTELMGTSVGLFDHAK